MQILPFENSDQNKNSRNFDLIEEIFMRMMDWKEVIIRSGNNLLSKSVYECMGQCLYQVSITDKLRMKDKHYLMNRVWENLMKSTAFDEESKEIVDELIEFGFGVFKCPIKLFVSQSSYREKERKMYLDVLRELWEERDQYWYSGAEGTRAGKFKEEVIDTLLYT